jgi:hypothetical protein
MKKIFIAVAVAAALSACGSAPKTPDTPYVAPYMAQPSDAQTAVKDAVISTEFTDQGVKLFYTSSGKLEKIQVYGLAPAWKGNVDVIAEADAKAKLVKFVHGEQVSTAKRVQIIAKSIDRAKDNTANKFKSTEEPAEFKADELEAVESNARESRSEENLSRRIAARLETTLVNTTTSIRSAGRLTGFRKVGDQVINDGKTYVAIYQWSERDQATSEFVRGRMR